MSGDDEMLIQAAKNWQDQARGELQRRKEKIGIRESIGLAGLLQPLEREVKKRQRHPLTKWQDAWVKVVGAELSIQTRPRNIKNGFLEVEVDNPALKSELESYYSHDLTEALKEELPTGKLRAIKFVLCGGVPPRAVSAIKRQG